MAEETQASQNIKQRFKVAESSSSHCQVQEFELSIGCSLQQSSLSIRQLHPQHAPLEFDFWGGGRETGREGTRGGKVLEIKLNRC